MKRKDINRIYFLGIGGIGMSALARYFKREGKSIYGYDKIETRLTKKLVDEGMKIHYEDHISFIPDDIGFVVYTPAIPEDHTEFQWFKENSFTMMKRAEVLGMISREKKTIAVAGTHGKTTTAAILSYILTSLGMKPTAFVGGIMKNYHSNFLHGEGGLVVVEADEYDRSFLHLSPTIAVITAIDPDHLDIYGSYEALVEAFMLFSLQLARGGSLWIEHDASTLMDDKWRGKLDELDIAIHTYGLGKGAFKAEKVNVEHGVFHYSVRIKDTNEYEFVSRLPGKHNISNQLVATAIALELGSRMEDIQSCLMKFGGIERRFETMYEDVGCVIINDYAHHPEELHQAIKAAKELYPDKKLTGIFQPHLYSRTNDFYEGFARELSEMDEVIVTEIYPARERAIKGVDSFLILNEITIKNKRFILKNELAENINIKGTELLLVMGAGDVDDQIPIIIEKFKNA